MLSEETLRPFKFILRAVMDALSLFFLRGEEYRWRSRVRHQTTRVLLGPDRADGKRDLHFDPSLLVVGTPHLRNTSTASSGDGLYTSH